MLKEVSQNKRGRTWQKGLGFRMKLRRMIKVQHTKLENTWWLAKRVVPPPPPLNDIHDKDDKSSTLVNWKTHGGLA
jgi:hypothetical protein